MSRESPKRRLDDLLQQKLRDLPAPPPSPGLADRVLPRRRRASAPARLGLAVAASLVIAVAIALWKQTSSPPASAPSARTVIVQRGQVQPVRLVFNSPAALKQVTLRVALPEGVEIAGFPGERELSWQTDLKEGSNVLELPVLAHGAGGILVAAVSDGADRREFAVELRVSPGERHSSLEAFQHA